MAESTINIGGAQKSITDGYINVGGTLKRLVRGYQNVGGVLVPLVIFKRFTWKKYAVATTTEYESYEANTLKSIYYDNLDSITFYEKFEFDTKTGVYTLSGNTQTIDVKGLAEYRYPEYKYFVKSGKTYKYSYASGDDDAYWVVYVYGIELLSRETASQSRGDYIGDVTSSAADAYPSNGIHTDGCWYVKQ